MASLSLRSSRRHKAYKPLGRVTLIRFQGCSGRLVPLISGRPIAPTTPSELYQCTPAANKNQGKKHYNDGWSVHNRDIGTLLPYGSQLNIIFLPREWRKLLKIKNKVLVRTTPLIGLCLLFTLASGRTMNSQIAANYPKAIVFVPIKAKGTENIMIKGEENDSN